MQQCAYCGPRNKKLKEEEEKRASFEWKKTLDARDGPVVKFGGEFS